MRTPNLGLLDHVAGPARGGATDWWMRIPAIRLADAHATTTSATHMCEFGWPSPRFGGRLGAVHGLEIPFIRHTGPKSPGCSGRYSEKTRRSISLTPCTQPGSIASPPMVTRLAEVRPQPQSHHALQYQLTGDG